MVVNLTYGLWTCLPTQLGQLSHRKLYALTNLHYSLSSTGVISLNIGERLLLQIEGLLLIFPWWRYRSNSCQTPPMPSMTLLQYYQYLLWTFYFYYKSKLEDIITTLHILLWFWTWLRTYLSESREQTAQNSARKCFSPTFQKGHRLALSGAILELLDRPNVLGRRWYELLLPVAGTTQRPLHSWVPFKPSRCGVEIFHMGEMNTQFYKNNNLFNSLLNNCF